MGQAKGLLCSHVPMAMAYQRIAPRPPHMQDYKVPRASLG